MSDSDGISVAIWALAIMKPVGGQDSAKLFEALRIRACREEVFDSPRLRVGSVLLLVRVRCGLNGDSVNEGNGSGADSFLVGVAAVFALLVAGGVEESMTG